MISIREAGFESYSSKGPPARTEVVTDRGWDEQGMRQKKKGPAGVTAGPLQV